MFCYKKSFTMAELVMTMVIIGVLAGLGSWFLVFFVDSVFSLPNRLNIDMAVSDILEIICEGDAQAGGLRFAQSVSTSEDNLISFIDQEGRVVRIEVSGGKVRRAIDLEDYKLIPYYTPDSLSVSGKAEKTFIYYSISGKIRKTEIDLEAQIGGISRQSKTAIALRIRYE